MGVCCSASLVLATGCIEEVLPTNGATEDQVISSDMAAKSMLWGMPASMNVVGIIDQNRHWDWGYGSIMHIRDVFTGDMPIISSGYNWYSPWEQNQAQGEDYIHPQYLWNFYWQAVLSCNKMLSAVSEESATEEQLGFLGAGHAWRAHFYLDMARMFEFLPNDIYASGVNAAGNNVTHLTVPIVRETITEEQSRNNPRATRDEMATFILEDLNKAEELIGYLDVASKAQPHLDVVYGLKARLYMWLEDYPKAQEYARKAIVASRLMPMTETQCLSTSTGFNDISCWMWGSQMVSEDGVVQTGILNWTSWMSNETSFGYSSQEPFLMIDPNLYNRMSNSDFRKKMWKAPEGTVLDGQTEFLTSALFGNFGNRLPAYASTKFRPANGNCDNHLDGAASAFPLMRVEEMYFIEAEAAAHQSAKNGLDLLNEFMSKYRDPQYEFESADSEEVIDEIIAQKRVELWGEGLSFFDIKRLNMSVTRGYKGTLYSDAVRFNTNGRPAWMNICIVQIEKNNNKALIGYENPDPSDTYEPWTAQ